jgi:hypothetical protein
MKIKDLKKATAEQLKEEYEADYKTAEEKKAHIHQNVIKLCDATEMVGTITYEVINVTTLATKGYTKLVEFLLTSLLEGGIRPDTPFHNNDESKYPLDTADPLRYMEYNVIGGGMRLVYDATTPAMFLSSHYSDPAKLNGGGDTHGDRLANIAAKLKIAHNILKKHSDGTIFNAVNNPNLSEKQWQHICDQLALKARESEAFIAWLKNKNARQDKTTVLQWYNVII